MIENALTYRGHHVKEMETLSEASIEITQKCLCNCLHCSSCATQFSYSNISSLKLLEVANSLAKLRVKSVSISGGEPFLHDGMGKFVNSLSRNGIRCSIYTSGIIEGLSGSPEPIPLERFMQLQGKTERIVFNLESVKEGVCDYFMGVEGFLPRLKKSIANARLAGLRCEAHFVPMKINRTEILDILQFCDEEGISELNVIRLFPHGRAERNCDELLLEESSVNVFLEKLELHKKNYRTPVHIGSSLICSSTCKAGSKIIITPEGKILPCEVFKHGQVGMYSRDVFPSIYESTLENAVQKSILLNRIRVAARQCGTCMGVTYWRTLKEIGRKYG